MLLACSSGPCPSCLLYCQSLAGSLELVDSLVQPKHIIERALLSRRKQMQVCLLTRGPRGVSCSGRTNVRTTAVLSKAPRPKLVRDIIQSGGKRVVQPGRLAIHNLPVFMQTSTVKMHFEQFGSVSYVEIERDPRSRKSTTYAYVQFEDDEPVQAVLADGPVHDLPMSADAAEHEWAYVDVSRAYSTEVRADAAKKTPKHGISVGRLLQTQTPRLKDVRRRAAASAAAFAAGMSEEEHKEQMARAAASLAEKRAVFAAMRMEPPPAPSVVTANTVAGAKSETFQDSMDRVVESAEELLTMVGADEAADDLELTIPTTSSEDLLASARSTLEAVEAAIDEVESTHLAGDDARARRMRGRMATLLQ